MNKKSVGFVVLIIALFSFLTACSSGPKEAATPVPDGSAQQPKVLTLDQVIEEAKKEGRLLVADSISTQEMMTVIKQFEEKYPFIKVEHLSEGGNDILNRIRQETDAKAETVDLLIAGTAGVRQLANSNYLIEVDWKSLGMQDSLIMNNYQVRGLGVLTVLGYNTNLVNETEKPDSWKDLIDQKWEKKIAVPITGWGSMAADLALVWGEEETEKYTIALKNNVVNVSQAPEVAPRVAAGEFPLGVMRIHHARIQMARGAPIKFVFLDPVPSPLLTWGIAKNGKNSNAAKLFVHWITNEGHKVYEEVTGRGNPWIKGSQAAKDVEGLNISAYDGDPNFAEERTKMEDKFSQLLR